LVASRFINELRISPGAEEELWGHRVIPDEVLEVLWNGPAFFRDKVPGRSLMIGRTDGNARLLTVVIEPTTKEGAWDVVTGWDADKGETTAWQRARRKR
jgi:hypothetical protein